MKKVAIFDIDGTVFRSSLLIELVEALIKAGLIPKEMRDEYKAEYEAWVNRKGSYDDYICTLVQAFLKYIKGVHYDDFKQVAEALIESKKNHVYRYTRDLIQELKDKDYYVLAISQSPKTVLNAFCKAYGFDNFYGMLYELNDREVFTGGQVNRKETENKSEILKRIVEEEGLTLEDSVGVGDSKMDVSFLEVVDNPICFNPSKTLYEEAVKRGWKVVVERKNVIYEL
jgi:HAD superfamily hydrolase (TIGR01490 family)